MATLPADIAHAQQWHLFRVAASTIAVVDSLLLSKVICAQLAAWNSEFYATIFGKMEGGVLPLKAVSTNKRLSEV